jgi:hypothetical protein
MEGGLEGRKEGMNKERLGRNEQRKARKEGKTGKIGRKER